ncbi:MAG TPA: hypothetical protein VNI57_01955, partial [Candidatus Saccharimonadales bacterium]|nr:hypothetical protein [Candidatus Saccharimonadales bacterium]
MADEQGRQSRLQVDLAGRCALVFRDPDAAAAEIARVARGDRQRAIRLATFLAAAPDPEGALGHLDRLGRTFKLPGSHEDLRSLILLLSHSSYLADVLHADREALAAALGA